MAVPEECPRCGATLYPLGALRPAPSFSWSALCIIAVGIAISVPVYWGGIVAIRSAVWIPMWLLCLAWFPVALLPALGFAWLASRFPRVAKVRCRRCGWRQRVALSRRRSPVGDSVSAESHAAADPARDIASPDSSLTARAPGC